jgi:hypothetical protein
MWLFFNCKDFGLVWFLDSEAKAIQTLLPDNIGLPLPIKAEIPKAILRYDL